MSPPSGPAVELALALFQAPMRLAEARRRPLPEGTVELLRLLGGAPAALEALAARLQVAPAHLHEACTFFVTELLFAPGADSYRVLGLQANCDPVRIKDHHRLLIRWLHPDRDAHGWHSVHAERVNSAWQDLRTPDRRRAYDARRPHAAALSSAPVQPVLRPDFAAGYDDPSLFAGRILPRLPALLLGTGASLAALLLLALLYVRPAVPGRDPHPSGAGSATSATTDARPSAPGRPSVVAAPAAVAGTEAGSTEAVPAETVPAETGGDPGAQALDDLAAVPDPPPPAVPPAPVPPAATAVTLAETPLRKPIREQARSSYPVAPAAGASLLANRPPTTVPASVPTSVPASIPPRAGAANAAAIPEALPQPDPGQAAALIEAFTTAYAAGDLPGLLSLFADDARIERGGLTAIAEDYGKLFESSRARRLSLPALTWRIDGGAWIGEGRFNASVRPRGFGRSRDVQGLIRFRLRDHGHGLRIERLDHQPDP